MNTAIRAFRQGVQQWMALLFVMMLQAATISRWGALTFHLLTGLFSRDTRNQ